MQIVKKRDTSKKNIKLVVSVNRRQVSTDDGYSYPVTKHLLNLYYYLALKRKEGPVSGGYATSEEILALPHWERNNIVSVGKQIRRHMLSMEKIGRNIIEAQQKIYGPFRLAIPKTRIIIDVPISVLMDELDLRQFGKLDSGQENDFYEFVEQMWEGDARFDEGHLADALSSYKKAETTAINSELRVAADHKIGRTLGQLGDFEKARLVFVNLLRRKGLNELEEASTRAHLAWVKYRQQDIDESEALFYKALDMIRGKKYYKILGQIYNGLGLIRRDRGEFQEALAFYQRALEYWSLADYFYGIQAAYFNIGNLYKRWGDRSGEKRIDGSNYQKAVTWVKRCISLCEKMGIAYETSQDYILLAALYAKTGDLKTGLDHAKTANDIAREAGNRRDIAYAYRILGKIYFVKGDKERAAEAFGLYLNFLSKIELPDKVLKEGKQEVKKILGYLPQIGEQGETDGH